MRSRPLPFAVFAAEGAFIADAAASFRHPVAYVTLQGQSVSVKASWYGVGDCVLRLSVTFETRRQYKQKQATR
jgi:hypothetical protein